jgi:serine phosphatase RsbU (regulator of sigma subunit)
LIKENDMAPHNESAKIQETDRTWQALLKISEEVHAATSIEEFVATIRNILADLIKARNFFICLYEESSGKYFFPYFEDENDKIETTGVSYVYDESLEVTMYDLSGTLTDYVRRSGKPVRFPNDRIDKLYESGEITLFGSQSISWLGVPLKLSGITIGVMAVQCYDFKDAYSAKDEKLMVFVSDHIARAIENVRSEERFRKQHLLVLQQKEAITDSISYARRIQKAVLPSPAYMDNILSEYFIVYKPKDILSGDFYWVREIDGYKVVVIGDSSGHGVPGALMSMLGVTLLNEQFRASGIRQPAEILGNLKSKVIEILAHEGSEDDQKDGMDMAMAIINPENTELQFAGANIPLFLIRMKENYAGTEGDLNLSMENDNYGLYRIRADKQPVGPHWEEADFSNHSIKLKDRDSLYIFSDGYKDQYGGKKRKKLKSNRLQKLLLSVQEAPMELQRRLLEDAFEKWRGNNEQIDDVCAVGIRI